MADDPPDDSDNGDRAGAVGQAALLSTTDFVLYDPALVETSLASFISSHGDSSENAAAAAIQALTASYEGTPHVAQLACSWLAQVRAADVKASQKGTAAPAASIDDATDEIATTMLMRECTRAFTRQASIALQLSLKGTPPWMQAMLEDKVGRKVLCNLAEIHPQDKLLQLAIHMICNTGHASEAMGMQAAVRNLDVYKAVLTSGLTNALADRGGGDEASDVDCEGARLQRQATTALARCAALSHESYWFAVRTVEELRKLATPRIAARCASLRRALDAAAALRAGPGVLYKRTVTLQPATADVPTTPGDAQLDDLASALLQAGGHAPAKGANDAAPDALFRMHTNMFSTRGGGGVGAGVSGRAGMGDPRVIAPGGLRHHPRVTAALIALGFRPFRAASPRDVSRAIDCLAVLEASREVDDDDGEGDVAEEEQEVRSRVRASLIAALRVCKRASTLSATMPPPSTSAAAAADEGEAVLTAVSRRLGCLALIHFARSLLSGTDVAVPMLAPADGEPGLCAAVWDDFSFDDEGAFEALEAAASTNALEPQVARPAAVVQLLCLCAESMPEVAGDACEAAIHALWRIGWEAGDRVGAAALVEVFATSSSVMASTSPRVVRAARNAVRIARRYPHVLGDAFIASLTGRAPKLVM